jgi:hypothetical protein
MRANHEPEKVNTTLGDLVAALSDAALEVSGDERGAYLLASLALEEILKKAPIRKTDEAEVLGDCFPEGTVFH